MLSIRTMMVRAMIVVALTGAVVPSAFAQSLTGAGSTFVDPIMTQWISAYDKQAASTVNYQAIGSGGGITSLINHTVDFAGSDVPMNPSELAEAKAPVIHIPDVVGAVTVAYDVPGIGPGLRLTGKVLSEIYLGTINRWNDPQITGLNPGTKLPNHAIFVAHRSDGSGTTAIFTDYLCKVNPAWKNGPGTGKSIDWPVGLGGKGNAGVSGLIRDHSYAIGYIELAYAVQNDIPYCLIANSHGKFIYPSVASAAAAAVGVTVGPTLTASLTDSPNPRGYPITGFSYIIVYKTPANHVSALKKFLTFIVTAGQGPKFTKPLDYARVPAAVCNRAKAEIAALR